MVEARGPGFQDGRVASVIGACGLLFAALAGSALVAPAASAAPGSTESIAVPKATGKVVQVGEGVSVQLETGWVVGELYPAAFGAAVPATRRHGPYVELYRNTPRAVFYVFADGYGVKSTASQFLPTGFSEWAHGWLVDRHIGKVDAFSLGTGAIFNSGATFGFTGIQTASPAESAHAVRGLALVLVNTSTGHAASVYAVAAPSNYTAAVQGQVEGMADSVVWPASG